MSKDKTFLNVVIQTRQGKKEKRYIFETEELADYFIQMLQTVHPESAKAIDTRYLIDDFKENPAEEKVFTSKQQVDVMISMFEFLYHLAIEVDLVKNSIVNQ